MDGNKPEKKFSAGAISATVWQNEGKDRFGNATTFRTVSFQRRYKDKDEQWKTSSSLRINDLPKASLVLDEAYKYLMLKDPDAITSPGDDGENLGKQMENETAGKPLGPEDVENVE